MTSKLPTLPAGWEWKKLDDIADIMGGGTPKTEIKEYWNGDIIWLSPTDLGEIGSIQKVNNSAKKISLFGLEKSSAKLLPIGTVLFSSRASIGKIGIAEIELSTNQGFANFICKPSIYNYYLAYAFKHFRQDIEDLSNSTTFKEVSKGSLKEFKIPLPPLDEQKRLVSLLDTLFAKIDRSIELLSENITAADSLLPSALNTVFRELRETWAFQEFQDCFIVKDGTHDSPKFVPDGCPLYTSKNLTPHGLDNSNFKYISLEDYEKINSRSKVDKGDLLFAMIGTIGNPTIVDFEPNFAIKNMALFKPKNVEASMYFLKYFLQYPQTIEKMLSESKGATQKFVGLGYLRKFQIPLPPLDIQTQTVAYLDSVRDRALRLKAAQNTKKSQLIALKASILDRVFKGEL